MPPRGTPEERFWKKVDRRGPGECWPWLASRLPRGYGNFYINEARRRSYGHRFSYELHNGSIPDGMSVLHRCDNPPCVNPAHLFLGTDLDNVRDMIAKGRSVYGDYQRRAPHLVQRGEARWNARLKVADIPTIRTRYAAGERAENIAVDYGVNRATIQDVADGRTWKHVHSGNDRVGHNAYSDRPSTR